MYQIEYNITILILLNVFYGRAIRCYSRQLKRLNNMPVMGSSLKWTVPSLQGFTIRLRGNELSLESLYRPACPRRILRQLEEEEKEEFN